MADVSVAVIQINLLYIILNIKQGSGIDICSTNLL